MLAGLAHILGLDDPSGGWYLFWSGVGTNLSFMGGAFVVIRKHQCHVHRCPRIARHPVAGTTWMVCRRHHGDDPPTADEVRAAGQPPMDPNA